MVHFPLLSQVFVTLVIFVSLAIANCEKKNCSKKNFSVVLVWKKNIVLTQKLPVGCDFAETVCSTLSIFWRYKPVPFLMLCAQKVMDFSVVVE